MSDLTLVLFLNQFFIAAETDKQAQNFDERPYRERRPKLPIPMGRCRPLVNKWFLGPTEVHFPNGICIGLFLFLGLGVVSNRQTHRHMHRRTDHGTVGTSATMPHLLPTAALPFSFSGFTTWIPQTVYCYF